LYNFLDNAQDFIPDWAFDFFAKKAIQSETNVYIGKLYINENSPLKGTNVL
jgi:hypothetical protein